MAASPRATPRLRKIPWSDLQPLDVEPLEGGQGVVFSATWKKGHGIHKQVAVKLLKIPRRLTAEAYEAAYRRLHTEATSTHLASESGDNNFVVHFHGLADGEPTAPWLERLAAHGFMVLAKRSVDAAPAGSGGGAAPQPRLESLVGLVSRWERGGSLHELLHKTRWMATTGQRLTLCAQLAAGLSQLHNSAGLTHGDIKAENVMMSGRGHSAIPRLADFGFSSTARTSDLSTMCMAHEKRGTWPYMAPEMLLEGAETSRSTDVYALATVVWEVLTGRRPWEECTLEGQKTAKLVKGGEGALLCLASPPLPQDTPEAVRQVLRAALSLKREERPQALRLADVLNSEALRLSDAKFDVFLSHAWAEGSRHAPITTCIYEALLKADLRVWRDVNEMGHDMRASMRTGVESSSCVVALMSQQYATRDRCLFKLRCAQEAGRPVFGCLADASDKYFFPSPEVLELVGGADMLLPDFRAAASLLEAASTLPSSKGSGSGSGSDGAVGLRIATTGGGGGEEDPQSPSFLGEAFSIPMGKLLKMIRSKLYPEQEQPEALDMRSFASSNRGVSLVNAPSSPKCEACEAPSPVPPAISSAPHRGSWRGMDLVTWCSLPSSGDDTGPLCTHGSVIPAPHWSWCV